ncbi:hypothetical protein [Variovorax sp. 770b2]|uniref:hypothetical protein n=1 Tax=Variovorax sp. 770b2 TaxID=1566271 RepID=UPI0008E0BB88|nr:hypothetical protein [Variovorax sp. 770b2]SFQ34058.1 hypothetical protein SAMN03159339_6844 [Variovorax sp. 770b2]
MSNHVHIQNLQSRFQRLLFQQHLVRRFRTEHPIDFNALRSIRDGLFDAIDSSAGDHNDLWPGDVQGALASWMTVAESSSARKAMREGNTQEIYRRVGGESRLLHWGPTLRPAFDFLTQHVETVEEMTARFNYFDYCSLMALASVCEGRELSEAFEQACETPLSETQAKDLERQKIPNMREYHLFQITSLGWSRDLRCTLQASAGRERFTSSSLHLLDSRVAPVLLGDEPQRDALYLRIDLSQAPADIDQALLYLRGAVCERLIELHGAVWRIPQWEAFMRTKFVKAQFPKTSLFQSHEQIGPILRGLWCWDLAESGNGNSDDAAKQISAILKATKEPRTKQAISNQWKIVEKIVRLRSSAGELDKAITGRLDVRLGLRGQQAAA